ncbi:MAG: EAL domain-containing protein [Pseudomonadales bacterium]|nr:EAL domain-containing protein [Pseudomonadales bacterium]
MRIKNTEGDFGAIRRRFIKRLKGTYEDITALLKQDTLSREDVENIRNIIHKLAGSGATFGFSGISLGASYCEDYLVRALNEENFKSVKPQLTTFLSVIGELIEFHPDEPALQVKPRMPLSREAKHVYLLEDDHELAGYIAGELLLDDYQVVLFSSVAEINEAVYKVLPAAIIADIILPEGSEAGIDWVNAINKVIKPPIPVIFISEKGDFNTRLNAVRAGADYYLKKPLIMKQLKQALYESVYKKPYTPYRVMLIDDDQLLAEAFKLDLLHHDINVTIVTEPFNAVEEIERFKPELILLDLYMPSCNGIELGQIIRQWPEFASIPIVFMSVERDVRKQLDAIRLAGDDFLVKPIEPWQLSVQVLARVRRARMINFYQEELATEIAHQKIHDQLTGLPNRNYMELKIHELLSDAKLTKGKLLALLWMDIDNFSHLNDVLGHKVGDQIIIDVANRLSSVLSNSDSLCRLGGDEYAILLNRENGQVDIETFCKEVMALFVAPFKIGSETLRVTLSMGVSLYVEGADTTAHEIIKAGDIALYHAKLAGRNNYVLFSEKMAERLSRNLWLESELRRSIDKDQLDLFYQPKFSADGKQLVGAEALLRWHHPEIGLISPEEFIPIAERSSLITDIAYWVMNSCCYQINVWKEQGVCVPPIAINLSARELEDPDFLNDIVVIPERYNIAPGALQIELTERTVAKQDSFIVNALNRLTSAGFSIAIDDFGTGYSSLKNLQQMPISLLKIDRSFVINVPEDKGNSSITETIVRLGEKMAVDVLAEGVETEAEAAFLQEIGCQYIQGFLYSKPLQSSNFLELIKSHASGIEIV